MEPTVTRPLRPHTPSGAEAQKAWDPLGWCRRYIHCRRLLCRCGPRWGEKRGDYRKVRPGRRIGPAPVALGHGVARLSSHMEDGGRRLVRIAAFRRGSTTAHFHSVGATHGAGARERRKPAARSDVGAWKEIWKAAEANTDEQLPPRAAENRAATGDRRNPATSRECPQLAHTREVPGSTQVRPLSPPASVPRSGDSAVLTAHAAAAARSTPRAATTSRGTTSAETNVATRNGTLSRGSSGA